MNRKNFLKFSIYFAFFALLLGGVWGQTNWIGTNGTAWDDPGNWDSGLPAPGNEPSIPVVASNWPSTVNTSMPTGWTSLTIDNGAQATIPVEISINSITNNGDLTLDANITLSGSLTGTGTVSAGATTLTVSGDFDVNSFTAGTSTVNLSGTGTVSAHSFARLNITGGTRTLTGNVTAQTFSSATGTNIAGAHNLIINGNAVFGGTAGSGTALASLSVSGTSAINGGSVNTSGTQTYTGNVSLGADATLTTTNANIIFGSDLNGAGNSLTVDSNLAFTKATVPVITNLPTLVFTGNNAQTFSPGGSSFSNLTFTTANTITLADAMTVTGNVTVNGVGAVVDFASNNTGFSQSPGQNFTITSGTVNVGTGQFVVGPLNVDSGGSFTQTGDNGANTQSVEDISGDGTIAWDSGSNGGSLTIGGSSATNINFNQKNVILGKTPITLSGIFYDLTVPASYTLNLGGKITVLNNLTNNGTIGINSQELEFLNYIEGVSSLVSISSGKIISTKGSSQDMSRLNFTSGNIATINGGSVGINILDPMYNNTSLNTNGIVNLPTGTIASLDVQSGTTTADELTVSGNVNVSASGALILVGDNSIGGDLIVAGLLNSTSGVLEIGGDFTLPADAGSFATNGGIIRFTGNAAQTVNPGLNGAGTPNVFSAIDLAKTSGSISFTTNPLTVTSLIQSNSDSFGISFNENLSVTNAVTFNTTGMLTLGNDAGDSFSFADGLSHTAGVTVLSGSLQTIDQDISFGNLTLSSNASIASGTGSINIGGNTIGAGHNLAISGDTSFSGTVSGLGSLKITGNAVFSGAVSSTDSIEVTGTSTINTTTITTTGAQTYTGAVTLGADVVLTTDSIVTFNGTVAGNSKNLTITGDTVFGDEDTDTITGVKELTVTGTSTINTTTITTTGAQTYTGAVTLGADVVLTTDSIVTFNNKVIGDSNSLSITGDAVFGNDEDDDTVIGVNELAVTGTSTINTTTITTSGNQTYDGDVILGANITLTTTNANIIFGSNLDGLYALSLTADTGDITVTGLVGATNSLGSLTITSANNVSFTGDVEAASFTQNAETGTTTFDGIQVYSGDFTFTGNALTVNKPLTVGGTTTIANSGLFTTSNAGTISATGGFSQTGAGSNSIGANISTTNNNISFAKSIDLTQDIVFSTGAGAGDISFSEAINSQGGERLLDLDAGTGDIIFDNTVGASNPLRQLVLRESSHVSFNGDVSASAGVITMATTSDPCYWTSASSINFPNTDIYFDHNGKTITLNSNLSARNIYFYRGNLNLANRIVNTTADFVVFGNVYKPNDPKWDGNDDENFDNDDTRFAYFSTPDLKYYPADGTYDQTDGSFSGGTSASFDNLSGSKISVGANFYNNGANMNVGAFTLNLASGTGSAPQFNATNAVIAGQWGTPYAVAFNMSVENSTANNWVTASTVAQGVSGQDITDGGTNTRWQFKRPEISAAATVFDNVIRITSSMPLRNANNEINSMVLQAAGSVVDGSIWYNSGALKFTGVFSDEGCNTPLSTEDPVTEFYIKTENGTWNTDATGDDPGVQKNSPHPGSSDRLGNNKNIIPNLSLLPGLFRAAEGVTMIQAYGTHGQALFDGTTDEARPVLIAVEIGQEAHESDPTLQAPYDAHNYIQLRYSEPVYIPGFVGPDMNEYIKIDDPAGPLPNTGKITDAGSGLEITNLISIASGSLSTGSRNIDNNNINMDDGTVHALYRNFSLDPSDTAGPQPHYLRISIAGWTDSTTPDLGDGISHRFYPGFIISAEQPSGTITVSPNSKIKDRAVSPNDFYPSVSPALISGSGWDTTPPSIAKYVEDEYGWSGKPTNESNYEIIGMDTGGGRVGHFELHLFDNEPAYDEDEDKWFFGEGWQDVSVFPDTRGGSGNKSGLGGIRMSSLVNSLQAFSYEERGSHFGPGMKGFKFDNASIKQNYASTFLGGPSVLTISDVPYLRLYLEDDDTTLFPMITNFSLQYKMYDQDSSPNGGFITDLAGNLLQDFKGLTVDRTPPSISMTLAPIGSNLLYVLFSKRLHIGDDDLNKISEGLSVTGSGEIAIDPSATVRVKSHIPVGTALIFQLGREVTFDDLLLGRITIDDGEDIRDYSKLNHAITGHNHVLSDFALGGIDVLYGYDNKFQILGKGVLAEGDWTLRDFTGTKLTTNKMLTDTDITIATRLSPNGDVDEEAITMILDVDPVSDSLSTIYNFNTDSDWTIWLPTLLPALSKTANAKAKEVAQETGEDAERNFIIPNDSGNPDSFNWKDGDEVEFFFRYDDGETGSFTFDHDGNAETPEVPLYFFRLKDPKDPTSVDLWRFSLSDISRQRGGITVLNNVINSLKKEETIVELDIKKAGNVTVHVLTLDGNIVKTLQRGRLNPGLHYFKWNGTNLSGTPVARGIYFMRVVGPDIDETRKVMVIKE